MRGKGLIDGGGAQQPSQMLPAHHLKVDGEGPAQHPGGLLHLPLFDIPADFAGADRLPVHQDGPHHDGLDAEAGAQLHQHVRIPGAILAEAVVEAAAHPPGVERLMEDLPNEFLRRQAADLLKVGLEDFRDPQGGHGRQLALGAHQLPSVAFGQLPRGLGKGENGG